MCNWCEKNAGYNIKDKQGKEGVYHVLICKFCGARSRSEIIRACTCASEMEPQPSMSYDGVSVVFSEFDMRRHLRERRKLCVRPVG